mmetsp:Transcript_43698/g.103852  ORF Transcript_43698/g.103852 Transcript_43698/m.103852 type:complete len:164 (-) Transcript_43698:221-712(-)|eukprot:CAMPEP_0180141478 /NCGR_PEP_ID=MMETSP0986-20121125/14928_1 /TAXON_ID=697907 /ORGANISM="non described non described, Strain CCMP2293" /LENGTH=163 /DNA_ID=CAMNT_0022084331 /DNA_START=27 /DNA_END=518 /DNA_ORIENTATION=+
MAKKGKKEKKQDAAAAEEASPQEVAAESPQSAAPIKKENQIEPATPPAPQDEPPAQEDPPAQQEDRQSEEAPAVGATPAEENIDGDASAPTPGASQAVPVSPIPKAPPGSCAVCRGRSNVELQDSQVCEKRDIPAVYLCADCIEDQPSSTDWKVWSHWMENKA